MIELTKDQCIVREEFNNFWKSSRQVFQFGGLAGTGKSTIAFILLNDAKILPSQVAAMSFVGNAAIVMRTKGLSNAKTIHSWLLEPKEIPLIDDNGNVIYDYQTNTVMKETKFVPVENIPSNIKVIYIDEGGTVPYWLKPIIESYNVKVIVSGDPGQLRSTSDRHAYLNEDDNFYTMTQIMRQNESNPLIYLATRARQGLPIHNGWYGGVLCIDRNEITDRMIMGSEVVLTVSNKTRDFINNKIRRDIFKFKSDLPQYGERMICRKNNWNIDIGGINLANGLNGIVSNQPDVSTLSNNTFRMNFKPNIIQNEFEDLLVDYDYLTADYNRRKILKNNKYSIGEKFEYSYATTVHVSQGNEYGYGMYIDDWFFEEQLNNMRYTAITRFKLGMIYVNQVRHYK